MVVLGKHFIKGQIKRTLNTHGCVVFIYTEMIVCTPLQKSRASKCSVPLKNICFSIAHTHNVGLICFIRFHLEIELIYRI